MLRLLRKEDAPLMLEWMHDYNVGAKLAAHFEEMKIEDCERFIEQSYSDEHNLHRAICTEEDDEYLGTISLKNIDRRNSNAEYAVSMRTKAIGTGMATIATDGILDIAFHELGLNKVYLYVFSQNIRAVRFYKKYGFVYEGTAREQMVAKDKAGYSDIMWFAILKSEYEEKIRRGN